MIVRSPRGENGGGGGRRPVIAKSRSGDGYDRINYGESGSGSGATGIHNHHSSSGVGAAAPSHTRRHSSPLPPSMFDQQQHQQYDEQRATSSAAQIIRELDLSMAASVVASRFDQLRMLIESCQSISPVWTKLPVVAEFCNGCVVGVADVPVLIDLNVWRVLCGTDCMECATTRSLSSTACKKTNRH